MRYGHSKGDLTGITLNDMAVALLAHSLHSRIHNVKIMNIVELNIFVPGQATPSDVGQLNRWNANPMTPNPGL